MNEPRKPLFGFLWPKPDPDAPVDGAYRQARPLRVCPRGLVRVALLLIATAVAVIGLGTAVMASLATGAIAPTIVVAAVGATLVFLVLRGWIVGTYVSDDAVRIETVFGRHEVPWSTITSVDVVEARCPMLGTPLRTHGRRVVLVTTQDATLMTHVYTTSPDILMRSEAFDVAASRLRNWSRSGPGG